jgi:hypothetical protein
MGPNLRDDAVEYRRTTTYLRFLVARRLLNLVLCHSGGDDSAEEKLEQIHQRLPSSRK